MIFDNIRRTALDPARHNEFEYSYLNRSARPISARVRELVEEWYTRYPIEEARELLQRLRSGIDTDFFSAFFELYLHELLYRLNYTITIHPSTSNGYETRPDFAVKSPTGKDFYLEAVLATGTSKSSVGAQARINEVYDAINDINSPNFFIGVRPRGIPNTSVPQKRLKKHINGFLNGLDPDAYTHFVEDGGLNTLPWSYFSHDGWNLSLFAVPKSPDLRGQPEIRPLSTQLYEAQIIDPRTPIRDAIVKKATRYGILNRPYFVAVNSISSSFFHSLDEIDIMEALFGKEQIVFSMADLNDREPKIQRVPDGAWTSPKGPRHTRVSAVLIVSQLRAWTVARETPWIYHNILGQNILAKMNYSSSLMQSQ